MNCCKRIKHIRGLLASVLSDQQGFKDIIPIIADYAVPHNMLLQEDKEGHLGFGDRYSTMFLTHLEYLRAAPHTRINMYRWTLGNSLYLQTKDGVIFRIDDMFFHRKQEIRDFLRQYSGTKLRNTLCEL